MMIFSWGMDGAGSQSKYKQRDEKEGFDEESHLFVVSVVPVQLQNGNEIYWTNPMPQSPLFCRPLNILFEKEDKVMVLRERDAVLESISRLESLNLKIGDFA
jgi:hypothetical protein